MESFLPDKIQIIGTTKNIIIEFKEHILFTDMKTVINALNIQVIDIIIIL